MQRTLPATGLAFRPDIEGLRGISVAAVILFHAFPALLPGGFVGVDVFFVISGFIITRVLLHEHQTDGRIGFAGFWARRIRRILPAATVVLVGTAALVCLAPVDARQIGKSVVASALFYLNWRQAEKGSDYLAADDGDNPMLHYWSLGVEEQFYMVWPLAFAALLALNERPLFRHPLAVAIAALSLISVAYGAYLTVTDLPLAFFSTLSRSWQFLCGALIAVGGLAGTQRYAGVMGVVGLAVLAASFRAIGPALAYPGILALAATLATGALIQSSAAGLSWGGRMLALPVLRGLGRVSFSLYLVHWPLLVVVRAIYGADPMTMSAAVALSLILSVAIYLFVEVPIRTSRTLTASNRKTFATGAALVAVGVLAGIALRNVGPDQVAIGPGVFVSGEAVTGDRPVLYDDGCLVRHADTTWGSCVYGAVGGARTVVLFGDSHAANWFPPLDAAAKAEGWRLVVRVRAACSPLDVQQQLADGSPYRLCTEWNRAVLDEISALQPHLIVVGSISNTYPVQGEQRTLAALAATATTIAMRDTPRLPESPIACLRREGNPDACRWDLAVLTATRKYPKTKDADLPRNVRVLDLNGRLCIDGICPAVKDGWPLMTDKHHLTARTSLALADAFVKELQKANGNAPGR